MVLLLEVGGYEIVVVDLIGVKGGIEDIVGVYIHFGDQMVQMILYFICISKGQRVIQVVKPF